MTILAGERPNARAQPPAPSRRPRYAGLCDADEGHTTGTLPTSGRLRRPVQPLLQRGRRRARPRAAVLVPLATRSTTNFALSPAAGVRLELGGGLGLRGDVGDLITFRGGTRHNVALCAGLSVSF